MPHDFARHLERELLLTISSSHHLHNPRTSCPKQLFKRPHLEGESLSNPRATAAASAAAPTGTATDATPPQRSGTAAVVFPSTRGHRYRQRHRSRYRRVGGGATGAPCTTAAAAAGAAAPDSNPDSGARVHPVRQAARVPRQPRGDAFPAAAAAAASAVRMWVSPVRSFAPLPRRRSSRSYAAGKLAP